MPLEILPQAPQDAWVYEGFWRASWRSLRRHPAGMVGLVGLSVLVLVVLTAPLLTRTDPTAMDYDHLLSPPGASYLFGTDDLGRDVFSRVLWGGRESLRVSLLAVLIAALGGTVVGMVSGYLGGWVDGVIMRLADTLLAFPAILLVLSIVAVLGPSLTTVLVALGVSSIPGISRFVRGLVLPVKNLEYVAAARSTGAGRARIMVLHILPNILGPIIVLSTLGLGQAIILTAGLSYIGLGAQPPSPEWGAMLNHGRDYLAEAWWMSVFPGAAIALAVLFINLLGDGLRDALDPKMRI
jgi:ABC-type dipeptide/oligopeptide/nickel transport system permease subunit